MKKVISISLVIIVSIFLLLLAVKGKGSPIYYQSFSERETVPGGPFESSGSTSRYALTESIVEDGTLFLNEERAKFAAPDVSKYNDKYFSIFTPGTSFLGVPFYFLGRLVGLPQLITYLSTGVLSLLNVFLVVKLARKLGAGPYSSLLAGFVFLFATNALSYALTYTQHHASTTLILLALLNVFGERTLLKNIWLGILIGAGLLVDIPNGIMMAPIVAWVVFKHFYQRQGKSKVNISIKLNIVGIAIGLLPLLALFGWYNYELTGSYTNLAQNIGRTLDFADKADTQVSENETVTLEQPKFRLPYSSRNQLNGFYILLISDERGLFYYSPIVLLGVVGMFLLYRAKGKNDVLPVLAGVIFMVIVSYSMFGDPWGGWGFGPRYLIPAAAILSGGIGIAVKLLKRKPLFILVFIITVLYSLGVNVLGAMTTAQIPPKVEAVNLLKPIPYTYEYNFQLLEEGKISSLVYNVYLSGVISVKEFVYGYYIAALLLIGIVAVTAFLEKEKGVRKL